MTASSADALNALGSDLAFSVSFSIANEIRASAVSSGYSDDELISIILCVSIILEGIPLLLDRVVKAVTSLEWRPPLWTTCGCSDSPSALGRGPEEHESGENDADEEEKSIVAFAKLILDIARRIAISLTIQLVAASVSARQPLRVVRILTLFSVAVFFLFLQNAAQGVSVASSASRKRS